MITLLGALFIATTVVIVAVKPDWLVWVLAAAVPFTATAGLNLAGQSLVMYPLVALVLVLLHLYRSGVGAALRANLTSNPGAAVLVALAAWCCVVTAVGPVLFSGTPVLDPRQGIDSGVVDPASLSLRLSNVAQTGYLLIGIATVIVIGTRPRVSPHLPSLAFGTGTIVSSLRYILPDSLAQSIFDTSNNVSYTAGEFNGIERLRGIFSEPAAFGAFSVAGAVFFLAASVRLSGPLKLGYVGLGVWAFLNAVYSFSGGALVTGLTVFALIGIKGIATVIRGQARIHPASILAVLAIPAVCLLVGGRVIAFVELMLSDKSSSSSYENRTAADTFSYDLAQQTYGVGVGLGSNRPSSFLASVVSTIGYLGLALMSAAVLILVVRAMRRVEFQPTVWALLTIIVSKAVAGPDVSDPPLWFLLGVCAFAAWNSPRSADAELKSEHSRQAIPTQHYATTDFLRATTGTVNRPQAVGRRISLSNGRYQR